MNRGTQRGEEGGEEGRKRWNRNEERSIVGLNLTGVKRIDRSTRNPVSAEQRGTPGDSYFKGETNRVSGTTTAIKSAVTTTMPPLHAPQQSYERTRAGSTQCFVKHPMTINARHPWSWL